jgi:hypothetical protein
MKSKFLASLVTCLITLSVTSVNAADTQIKIEPLYGQNVFGFVFIDDDAGFGTSGSVISAHKKSGNPLRPQGDAILCTSLSDIRCQGSDVFNFNSTVLAGPCSEIVNQPCVENLRIIDRNGISHEATFTRNTQGSQFVGNLEQGLPDGKSVSLWRTNDFEGEKNYSVTYLIRYTGVTKLSAVNFALVVQPFEARSNSTAREIKSQERIYPDGVVGITSTGRVTNANCAWQENSICGVEQEFNSETKVEISFLVPNNLSGWLNGRLKSPEIKIEKFSSTLNRVTVNSLPADVPSASVLVPYAETNEKMKDIYKFNSHALAGNFAQDNVSSAGKRAFLYLDAFEKVLGDKASTKKSSWKIGSLSPGSPPPSNCLDSKDRFLGVVSTNAMIFDDGPPEFADNSFNYKVGGLHLNPDGSIFRGSYDLSINSDVARCLYRFSNAPISAEISVVSSSGERQITSTMVKESNGWINLGVYNFTFSNPSIRIKLLQDAPSPSPSTSPVVDTSLPPTLELKPISNVLKKFTITCAKGKTTKKVTAVNPKCPAGYKKK